MSTSPAMRSTKSRLPKKYATQRRVASSRLAPWSGAARICQATVRATVTTMREMPMVASCHLGLLDGASCEPWSGMGARTACRGA